MFNNCFAVWLHESISYKYNTSNNIFANVGYSPDLFWQSHIVPWKTPWLKISRNQKSVKKFVNYFLMKKYTIEQKVNLMKTLINNDAINL